MSNNHKESKFHLPIVYNTSGYLRLDDIEKATYPWGIITRIPYL